MYWGGSCTVVKPGFKPFNPKKKHLRFIRMEKISPWCPVDFHSSRNILFHFALSGGWLSIEVFQFGKSVEDLVVTVAFVSQI